MQVKLRKSISEGKDDGKLTNSSTQLSVSKPTSGFESPKSIPQEVYSSPVAVLPFATLVSSSQTLCSRFMFENKKLKQKLRQSEKTEFDF